MSRTSPLGLLHAVTRAFALVTVVLVVGFGTSLHAQGFLVDDAVPHTGFLEDVDHDGSHQDIGVLASETHCGGGAVCLAALPSATLLLPAPETRDADFAIVDFPGASSRTCELLRPPRIG